MIRIAKLVTMLVLCVCYTGLVLQLGNRASKIQINWKEQMDKLLLVSGEQLKGNQKWYEERKVYLSRIGVNYLAGRTVLPEEFFLLQVSVALLVMFLGVVLFGKPGVLFAVLGFLAPGFYVRSKNEKDNKAILNEVKRIYDTIQVKTQGGMFLTSAIVECYKNTKNRRLKQALYEMSGQIIAKNNLLETIDTFNLKFKNQHIDNLCIILKQSLDTGKTVEIIESIQDQLLDMQEAINLQKRNKLNKKIFFVQMLLYVVLIGVFIAAILHAATSEIAL